MKNKTKTLKLISKVLLFVCVLAVSSLSTIALETGSLTFKVPTNMSEDLSNTTITVDLYQVATYNNGTYTNASEFESIELGNDAVKNVEAIEAVLENKEVSKYKTVTVGTTQADIDLGYYYYVVQEDVSGKNYTYEFNTGVVSLPAKDSTLGTLVYEREVDLKGTRSEKEGSITITKSLDSWNETSNECTFVFSINAVKDEKTVYSNVASISFNKSNHGSNSVTVSGIPVGSTVTVSEIYSGGYTQTSVTPEAQVITGADVVPTFDFTNKYSSFKKSYGVENQFKKEDSESDWKWTPVDIKGVVTGGEE